MTGDGDRCPKCERVVPARTRQQADAWLRKHGFSTGLWAGGLFATSCLESPEEAAEHGHIQSPGPAYEAKLLLQYGGKMEATPEILKNGRGVAVTRARTSGNYGMTRDEIRLSYVERQKGGKWSVIGVGTIDAKNPKEMTDLAVLPQEQGKGIGTAITKKAREMGVIWLGTPWSESGYRIARKYNRESFEKMPNYVQEAVVAESTHQHEHF